MDISLNRLILEKINNIQDQISINKQDDWMCIKEIVQYTKLSDSTIRREIKKGLRVSKRTGKLLCRRSWIDKWLGGNNE